MPEKVSTVFLRKESKRLAASGEPVIVLPRNGHRTSQFSHYSVGTHNLSYVKFDLSFI